MTAQICRSGRDTRTVSGQYAPTMRCRIVVLMALAVMSACGENASVVSSSVPAMSNVPEVSASVTSGASTASAPLSLVGPPDTGPDWPFTTPSGGVMLAAANGYEYDRGEPDDLVRRSVAVATATVMSVGEPEPPVRSDEQPSDETAALEFVHDVVIPVALRIDDVIVGSAVEAGAGYTLDVSAWVVDGSLFEFAESRVPRPGERYLLFITFNRLVDAPAASGAIRTAGAGDGRVPLDEAESGGMLVAARWRDELAADFDPGFAEELRSAGLLP